MVNSASTQRTTIHSENLFYQRRLAQSLLRDMGFHEAVHWCQECGWEGVLQILLAKQAVLQRGDDGGI